MLETASRRVSVNGVEPRQVVETGIGGKREGSLGRSAVADADKGKSQIGTVGASLLILIEEDPSLRKPLVQKK